VYTNIDVIVADFDREKMAWRSDQKPAPKSMSARTRVRLSSTKVEVDRCYLSEQAETPCAIAKDYRARNRNPLERVHGVIYRGAV
jgi:hypothetical protein